uniref:ER membrane protein complex subunit 4 n=1 Tax=Rhodosorus marinus TaxID=101924 RepID=A0A7S3A8F0_9RHOD|mmetsp:Transcript_7108/g.31443  ORF Transcript_7108/g.31443 Transcript_7108/m.31443 type:complete len:208 (+) Transcript_7108:2373-2996(+)
MGKETPLPRKWGLNYVDEGGIVRGGLEGKKKAVVKEFYNPPGWKDEKELESLVKKLPTEAALERSNQPGKLSKEKDLERLRELQKNVWVVAFSPGKNVLLTAFMLLVAARGTNVFTIMTVISMLFMQLNAISNTNKAFSASLSADPRLNDIAAGPKLVYILLCSVGLSIALYKGYVLGLLPLTESDWRGLVKIRTQSEKIGAAFRMS